MKTFLGSLGIVLTAAAFAIAPATSADEPRPFGLQQVYQTSAIVPGTDVGEPVPTVTAGQSTAQPKHYSCPMHPQVRSTKPAECPICGMKLTPVGTTKKDSDQQAGQHERTSMNHQSMAMPGHAGMPMNGDSMHHTMCGCAMCMQMMGMGGMNHNSAPANPKSSLWFGNARGGPKGGRGCGC